MLDRGGADSAQQLAEKRVERSRVHLPTGQHPEGGPFGRRRGKWLGHEPGGLYGLGREATAAQGAAKIVASLGHAGAAFRVSAGTSARQATEGGSGSDCARAGPMAWDAAC